MLDEPSSALDAATEAAVFDNLARLDPRPTTVLIAHRLSTARDADRIVVLEDGRAVEAGTHDDLLAAGGAYARLWALQHREHDRRWRAAADRHSLEAPHVPAGLRGVA